MKELWKDIPRYEGLYQASTNGEIRTHKDKVTIRSDGQKRHWKQRILKPKSQNDKTGYRVTLWKDGKPRDFLVARLVLTTFKEDLIETNMTAHHIDGNRFNNYIDNIVWKSREDNIRLAFEDGLMPCCHKIKLINKKTNEITTHRSKTMASKFIGYSHNYLSKKIIDGIYENHEFRWEEI